MAIELNFDDIKGLAKPGTVGIKTPGGLGQLGDIGGGQDIMQSINGLLDRVNTTMINFKEMIGLVRGVMPGIPGPGAMPGVGQGRVIQPYQPQPTLGQQLHQVLNVAYSMYGDISVAELIQGVLQQYGGTKLSAALKALERL